MNHASPPAWLPEPLHRAITARTLGATGVSRLAIEGLLEFTGDRTRLVEAADFLAERLPGYASMWHIGRAARSADPAAALRRIRTELDDAVARSVDTAARWVAEHGGLIAYAPSSSVVAQVLDRLGEGSGGSVGLAGADAIGPAEVLNIVGTRDLAEQVPTLVVTTSLKLVPQDVFARLGAPVFEPIPLKSFAGVVLDGELVEPEVAGRRAAETR
jgi:hypothetical protein